MKDLIQLDKDVSVDGGSAKAGQDDVYVCGHSHLVFSAIERFSTNIKQRCGLNLQREKCKVLAYNDLPANTP